MDIREKLDKQLSKKKTEIRTTTLKPTELSPELNKVRENLIWIKELVENPIKKDVHSKIIYGVEVDPLPLVFGDNINNRSIYTTDQLCDQYDSATIEQRLKYRKKKRTVDSKLLFLLLILGVGVPIIIIGILFAMGFIGG